MDTAGVGKLKLLVVDHDVVARSRFCDMLRKLGAKKIFEAEDMTEALSHMRLSVPEIVFHRWNEASNGTIAFARQVRQAARLPFQFAVIVAVGTVGPDETAEAMDTGLHAFLTESPSLPALARILRDMVEDLRHFVSTKTYFGPDRRRAGASSYAGKDRRTQMPRLIAPPYATLFGEVASSAAKPPTPQTAPSTMEQRRLALKKQAAAEEAKQAETARQGEAAKRAEAARRADEEARRLVSLMEAASTPVINEPPPPKVAPPPAAPPPLPAALEDASPPRTVSEPEQISEPAPIPKPKPKPKPSAPPTMPPAPFRTREATQSPPPRIAQQIEIPPPPVLRLVSDQSPVTPPAAPPVAASPPAGDDRAVMSQNALLAALAGGGGGVAAPTPKPVRAAPTVAMSQDDVMAALGVASAPRPHMSPGREVSAGRSDVMSQDDLLAALRSWKSRS
ncbi:MAG: hypothetical protein H7840_06630 [Alphaproteobacteria bacterium]